jgi:2-hydroxy-3-oxopropionate reductase
MGRQVGFVGVGIMGGPMAANLLRAGHQVAVVAHRTRDAVDRLVEDGATECATAAEVASRSEIVVTCLPNDAIVEQVLLGPGGIAEGARDGLLVVDTSTIAPQTSQRLAEVLAARGVTLLDAPISGGPAGAQAGTLAIMVGGPRQAFDAVRPVLEAMGKGITYVGANGSALVVKLANNLIVAANLVAISEAFTMAARAGVDTALVREVLMGATARSQVLENKVPASILKGDLQPGFKLSLMSKDMGLALDSGQGLGVPMFATALIRQLYALAEGLGKGDLDCIAVSQLYTEATGTSLVAGEQ